METGQTYRRAQIQRAVIGAAVATALLLGAWRFSAGGPAGLTGVPAAAGGSDTLQVDVSGVRNDHGQVIGSLCKQGQIFVSGCTLTASTKALPGVVRLEFKGLATGDYALALYHDANGNGALELGAEGIGFSNNANLAQAAPDFEASRIKVAGATSIRVRLRYPLQ